MTQDEIKLYNSFKNATPEQQNKFTEDDWNEAERLSKLYKSQPASYKFQPGQREELLANIREVGYSGLDDTQKALYKQQYDASDYAKAGHSFEDAVRITDEKANQNSGMSGFIHKVLPEIPKAGYNVVRENLSYPIGVLVGSGEYAKDRLFGEEGWATGTGPKLSEYVNQNIELGKKGEGVTGMISDPATAAQVALGAGTFGASIPAQALVGGLGGSVSHAMNTEAPTVTGTLLAGGLGSLMSGGATALFGAPERKLIEKEANMASLAADLERAQMLQKYAQFDQLNMMKKPKMSSADQLLMEGFEPSAAQSLGQAFDNRILRDEVEAMAKEQAAKMRVEELTNKFNATKEAPLFPNISRAVGNTFEVSNPFLTGILQNTGVSRALTGVGNTAADITLTPRNLRLLSNVGTVGAIVGERMLDKKAKRISERYNLD